MKFKKLELTGFKSFFDKTTFFIEDGLTGIVGPNGCGKSNIVESLRWCMGETSAKSMRGAGMEDIIFAGTSNRPEKNFSEVSLLIDNKDKDGPEQYHKLDEILIRRKIERNKGSKYYLNEKEVRARDAQTFFADLSTGAHSPSLISQGKIGQLVIAKPVERRSILEEAAGIAGIHVRRHEAEARLNAAENNLKRADELKKQQQKQLDNLKKQAEEATKYKEISKEIRRAEAGLYYLKLIDIEKNKKEILENVSEQDDEISAIKIDLNHNTELLNEENAKLTPLRDRKLESLAKLQKINLDMTNLEEKEKRIKKLSAKLESSLLTIESDLEREKSISLDASLNEKRILEEKDELLKTEKTFGTTEVEINENLELSKRNLDGLKKELENLILEIGKLIDKDKKIPKDLFNNLKNLVDKITLAHENYATNFSKNETVKSDSIKRKERIKNIDIELENWKSLKVNSEKMINDLQERKKKINNEMRENQKNPEIIATTKGQNIQNLENTKKRSEELTEELNSAEERFNKINNNIRDVQEKLTILRENKARNEATLEGIATRKKDLFYSINAELNITDETKLLSLSEFNIEELPSIDNQISSVEKIKKERESMGTVNLRADIETKKFEDEIKKMEDDRADLFSAIVKLKSSIEELNQKGRERLLDAFEKVNRKFNEVYTKLFSGGSAKLELVDSDDPLEAGLEMFVSPPGKRLQSITLLSGGEQALTALSLIFAVFLVNPSPICVLDEVDAPLDDANVTRFCSLLDELTSITKTRFIIITHHALTMSRMHRLYGITMPEKGISQLVAVDLEKAEELVA
ncbi:MAG: chromosome segregation protein SMC [Candidatus Pelagibacter sp.]|nr:chromosome segregation protein SMC [Candidatus Pelagibacter sp.]OUW69465.1 MAG: chromosome segregation protein SMC [Candidatus Pelagibacter sp. TMED202]|tara:strand:+ start:17325 stop:19760 length:2436 start_codon:yes stop_codon:yes gene_type:complete